MRKLMTRCALAGAALTFAAAKSANASALLFNFESSDPGGATDGFVSNGATPAATSTGATKGKGALQITSPAFGGFEGVLSQESTSEGTLSAQAPTATDVTVDVTSQESFSGTFSDLGVVVFGYNSLTGGTAQFQTPAEDVDFTKGTEKSVDIPLTGRVGSNAKASLAAFLASGPYAVNGFEFFTNYDSSASDSPIIDVDNVNVITPGVSTPEPASLGLIAIGAGTLIRRRRV